MYDHIIQRQDESKCSTNVVINFLLISRQMSKGSGCVDKSVYGVRGITTSDIMNHVIKKASVVFTKTQNVL